MSSRLRQFSRVFGGLLNPAAHTNNIEAAYAQSLEFLGVGESSSLDNCVVKFRHRCRCATGA